MEANIPRRNAVRALWFAVAGSAVGLIVLWRLNDSVSTGWRLYVLADVLRAAWAATAAVITAGFAVAMVDFAAGQGRRARGVGLFQVILALVTSISALGYFMPNWSFWTGVFAGAVLLLWAAGLLLAAIARADENGHGVQ